MNDLALWRLLAPTPTASAQDADALAALLEQARTMSLQARLPFLARLLPATRHADARVRAGAVRMLAGADGVPALEAIARALDDRDPGVVSAAIEALAASAAGSAARWMHAIFHPRSEVRRAAVARGELAPGALELHLVADPETRELVLPKLAVMAAPQSPAPPPHVLSAVLALASRGVLPRPLARALLAHPSLPFETIVRMLEGARERPRAGIDVLLGAAATDRGPAGHDVTAIDALDDVLELFWAEDDDTPEGKSVAAFFRSFALGIRAAHAELGDRAVAALVATSVRTGGWTGPAARALVLLRPAALAWTWLPLSARHAGLEAFRDVDVPNARLDDATLKALLVESDLVRRDDGALDLGRVAVLLRLARATPIRLLRSWIGTERIVDAFFADVENSLPLLLVEDASCRGQADLFDRIARRDPSVRTRALSLLAQRAPLDRLGFLERLDGELAAEVLAELASAPVPAERAARLAELLGGLVAQDYPGTFLQRWLGADGALDGSVGLAALAVVANALDAERFVAVALELDTPRVRRLCEAIGASAAFPYGKEAALAVALADRDDEVVRTWARARIAQPDAEGPPRTSLAASVPHLHDADAVLIASCPESELALALAPCLAVPMKGVAAALARRPVPSAPSIPACVALLGAADPMAEVDTELARFGSHEAAWLERLDAEVVRVWQGETRIGPAGNAWQHRWERHAFAFSAALGLSAKGGGEAPSTDGAAHGTEASGGPPGPDAAFVAALERTSTLRFVALAESVWNACATLLSTWRWRERETFLRVCSDGLADLLVDALATEHGEAAARMLWTMRASGLVERLVESRRARVVALLPDLAPAVRDVLAGWVRTDGLVATPVARRAVVPPDAGLRERIATSRDVAELLAACRSGDTALVQDAALRLVELGAEGVSSLVALLDEPLSVSTLSALAESVALWPDGPWIADLEARARDEARPPELRFRIAAALFERGDGTALDVALEAACRPSARPWFRPEDWARLRKHGAPELELALALARSPEPHAYTRAVGSLLATVVPDERVQAALRGFLELGTDRMAELRMRVARWLAERSDFSAWPLVLAAALDEGGDGREAFVGAPAELVVESVKAAIAGGPRGRAEAAVLEMLGLSGIDSEGRAEALGAIVTDSCNEILRSRAVALLGASRHRSRKLREIAEAFAWGVLRGRELTGRLFSVKMLRGRGLGHTRLDTSTLHVSAMPILRREPHGREIVEGLVLHEIGHHAFHRGEEQQRVWNQAKKDGVYGLLNLVADEHLERNLRAIDSAFGDRLKRLASYAFMRSTREIDATELLDALGAFAFDVLVSAKLGVARRRSAVLVGSGAVLGAIEHAGMPFGRFVRALRMGLGNRHGDPDVERGLALFRGGFRKSDMHGLLAIAHELRRIFGWQTRLVETFGGHESLSADGGDLAAHGERIDDAEIDEEIERILDPRKRPLGKDGGHGKRWISVGPSEGFEPITNVQKLPHDPAEHARYATLVARSARRMRRFFLQLGLSMRRERMRVSGRRFDPTRARAMLVRSDPRVLVTRKIEIATDLFLGLVIDCSGSMAARDHMEQAKRFAVLLAEAARDLPGIDVRIFGFTDVVIMDCGDAERCSVHALRAHGGNNDAAALFYVGEVARASGRRAKLVVMISDGLPTECTVAALKAVVARLTRMRIACAQVAVQPLSEICFSHYVVVSEDDPDVAVRRFGAVVARLVRQTMAAR